MRVTSEMMVTNSLRRLNTRLESYERIQSQLATGKRHAAPSDDAGAAGRALSLRASQRAREQEIKNAVDARSWLDITDTQLQAGSARLQRARELAVRGASDLNATERNALAQELRVIQSELVGIANFAHRGRPIFAGTQTGQPVVATGNPPVWTYAGDDGKVLRRVADNDVVQVNVTAAEVFGLDGSDNDVFARIDALITALQTGDAAGVAAGIGDIDAAQDRLHAALAKTGAAANWVDSAQMRSVDTLHAIRTELSQVEDVDLAEAVMDLQVQETAYQATLQAIARALPPSLASFLR